MQLLLHVKQRRVLPVHAVVLAARTVTADRAQVFAARQRVIRRIRRDRLALAAGRRAQEVAVTTSIEGSYMQSREQRVIYESTSLRSR